MRGVLEREGEAVSDGCEGCKYWSEMLAEARGSVVVAMCLHPERKRDYTSRGCEKREVGEPVDLPTRDPR